MMQNEADPSNNIRPDNRMGVSSDLDRCRELILKLTNTLGKEQDVENRNRVEAWRKRLKKLEGKCCIPSVTVGVVGTTGTGKSSLLNAIIDEYNVLPTSGTQACTAVVVKIQNNYKNYLYEADIEFLSIEEWDYELQLLITDFTDKNGKMKKKMNPSPGSEAHVAYLKITAVYGEFDSFENLKKPTIVTSYLGKTETIQSKSASDFRNQVDKFIENTTTKTGGQFWPIIKSVTIRIPSCGVCSSGVTLVDLPGVGDANAARDKIAKEYLQNCSVILIATEISRACSSKTAKHLLGENFRRQLLMDGQYGNIAFVCTKNDVVTPTELIRELKLEDKTDHLRKDLDAMNIRVDELNKEIEHLKCVDEIQKHTKEMEQLSPAMEASDGELKSALSRKNKELSLKKQDKQNEIESLEAKKNKLKIKMVSKRKTMKLICAKARTEFVSKEIKKDFKAGIKEMKRKAKMTPEEIEEDEEDSADSDDDDDDDDSHLTKSCENLKVFCVSSSEYQKLKNKLTDDGPPMVFDCEVDTGIPAVRQFVQRIAEKKEEEATKRLIQNLALFIYDIEDYLTENENTCENDRTIVQSAVTHFSSRLMKELSPGLDQLSNTLNQEINHIEVLLIEGVEMAVKCALATCLQWGLPVDQDGFCFMTYQATIRRNGEYKSKASGNINFNEDLVAPLISSIIIEWNKLFSSELWDILDKYKQEIQQTYMTFTNALCKELHSLNLSMTDLKKTRSLLDLHVKYMLTEMIIDLEKVVVNRQRNINRVFTPIIKEHLMETYENCKKEKGAGVFNRIKQKLQAGVNHSKCTMFEEASRAVQSQLQQLMKEVISKIKKVCQKICEISSAVYEPFWDSSEASKQLKTTLYDDISEAALNISDLCSRTGVELPLRATTSTEPMSHTTSPQMSPSTRAVTSPTEISITSSSRSEIYQLPTSVYYVNDMPSCSTTNVKTENISSVTTEMPSYSTTENSTEIASTQRQQYPQISSGTVEGANCSASGLPPKSQQSYPGNNKQVQNLAITTANSVSYALIGNNIPLLHIQQASTTKSSSNCPRAVPPSMTKSSSNCPRAVPPSMTKSSSNCPRAVPPSTTKSSSNCPRAVPPSTTKSSSNCPRAVPPSTTKSSSNCPRAVPPSTTKSSSNCPRAVPPSTTKSSSNCPRAVPPSTTKSSSNCPRAEPSSNCPRAVPPSTTKSSSNCPRAVPPSTTKSSSNCPRAEPPSTTKSSSNCPRAVPPSTTKSSSNCPRAVPPSTTKSSSNCPRAVPPSTTKSSSNCPRAVPPSTTKSSSNCPRAEPPSTTKSSSNCPRAVPPSTTKSSSNCPRAVPPSTTKSSSICSVSQSTTKSLSSFRSSQSATKSSSSFRPSQSATKSSSISNVSQSTTKSSSSFRPSQSVTKSSSISNVSQSTTKSSSSFRPSQSATKSSSISNVSQSTTKSSSAFGPLQNATKSSSISNVSQSTTKSSSSFRPSQSATKPSYISNVSQSTTKSSSPFRPLQSATKSSSISNVSQSTTKSSSTCRPSQSATKLLSISNVSQSTTKPSSSFRPSQSATKSSSISDVSQSTTKSSSTCNVSQSTTKSSSTCNVSQSTTKSSSICNVSPCTSQHRNLDSPVNTTNSVCSGQSDILQNSRTSNPQIHRSSVKKRKSDTSQTTNPLNKRSLTSVHRSDLSQPIESENDRSFASQHKYSTSKAYQSLHEDVLSKKNIQSLGKPKSSLSKQQTHSGIGKDGITDAASLVPEVKVKTELSDYSTPPKRRKIRKELKQEFLNILDQCPSKLKKNILMRSGKDREKLVDEMDPIPQEKKVKTEPSTSTKSHPSSHHHTMSNHDRKSDHHKSSSEHHGSKAWPGKKATKTAVDSKTNSVSVPIVLAVNKEPQVEVKSEPIVDTVLPPTSVEALVSATTATITIKEYRERRERERWLGINKPKDQLAAIKSEKSMPEIDIKQQTSSRHLWTDMQKQSENLSNNIAMQGDRHTPDVQKRGDRHTPDVVKHRKSSSHKYLIHEGKRHGHEVTKHSHSKHGENKHLPDNDSNKHVIVNHESSTEVGKLRIKTEHGSLPQVNKIGKIRIKTDQCGSPVVKQEAELVPEMKIQIKTESGISPRIKAEPGVSPRVKVEPGISPTVSQDAASPLKMRKKIKLKEHHKSSHLEQKVPSLKISSKMLTESRHGDHRLHREHKSRKSKHSDKEHHKSHTGTNGKLELKLALSMSAIHKHKSDSQSKKHHKSSHWERSSSDEKHSGKSAHSSSHQTRESAHSSGNRKRLMSPNADANAQSKNKMLKTDTTGMNRTSSDYSVFSMDLHIS